MLVVYPYENPATTPSLIALLGLLARDFSHIDVLCRTSDCRVEFSTKGISFLRRPRSIWNPLRHIEGLAWLRRLVTIVRNLWLWWRAPTLLLGIDPEGLVYLGGMNRLARRPLIYLSFELMISDELSIQEGLLKAREVKISQQCPLVIIQDEERAVILRQENSLREDFFALLPNAPLPSPIVKSDYIRKKFGLEPDIKIVLYAGNLAPWSGRDLFEELVSYWPDRFVLVINSRTPICGIMHKYLRHLQSSGRVYFTSAPSTDEDMVRLIAAADYGLAPYRPVPDGWGSYGNMTHIGLSSGKVGYYAMCGLPILASALPAYCSAFREYRAGGTYSRLAESGQVLSALDNNYHFHAAESRRWYEEVLNPSRSLEKIQERIRHLA